MIPAGSTKCRAPESALLRVSGKWGQRETGGSLGEPSDCNAGLMDGGGVNGSSLEYCDILRDFDKAVGESLSQRHLSGSCYGLKYIPHPPIHIWKS